MQGKKNDEEKPRLDLLPKDALIEIGKVLTLGSHKYSANNWRGGFCYTRLIAAIERHLFAFEEGENNDLESGLSHLAHAACEILFLLTHQLQGLGKDDRYDHPKERSGNDAGGTIKLCSDPSKCPGCKAIQSESTTDGKDHINYFGKGPGDRQE